MYTIFLQEPVITDPYEAAVVSLPVAVKERLLRILRLGIATRYDVSQSLAEEFIVYTELIFLIA